MSFAKTLLLVLFLGFSVAVVSAAFAQQLPALSPEQRLVDCQEELADVRSAVTQVHQPNAAFQAEKLVTLNRKLGEAQQKLAHDAKVIEALGQEVETLKKPVAPAVKPEG